MCSFLLHNSNLSFSLHLHDFCISFLNKTFGFKPQRIFCSDIRKSTDSAKNEMRILLQFSAGETLKVETFVFVLLRIISIILLIQITHSRSRAVIVSQRKESLLPDRNKKAVLTSLLMPGGVMVQLCSNEHNSNALNQETKKINCKQPQYQVSISFHTNG